MQIVEWVWLQKFVFLYTYRHGCELVGLGAGSGESAGVRLR